MQGGVSLSLCPQGSPGLLVVRVFQVSGPFKYARCLYFSFTEISDKKIIRPKRRTEVALNPQPTPTATR